MKRVLVAAALCLLPALAGAQSLPEGWTMEQRGGEVILRPTRLKAGQVFVATVLPEVEPRGRTLRDWFEGEMKRDSPRQGKVIEAGKIEAQPNGALASAMVIERRGERLVMLYMAAPSPRGKHQMVRVISSPDEKVFRPNLAVAGAIIAGQKPPAPAEEADDEREARRPSKPEPKPDPTAAYRTAPGRGIPLSQIADVRAQMTVDPAAIAAGMTVPTYKPVLLLKNGEYCSRIDVPVIDMDAAAHKQAHPKAWGKWRRRGSKYEKTDSRGKWVKADWKLPLFPARPGDRPTGLYRTTGSGGNTAFGGDISVHVTNSLTFLPGGRFAGSRFGATTIGGSGSSGTSGVSGVVTSKDDSDGTYRIDHGVLELRFDDGRVERRAMNWGSSRREGSMFLNMALFAEPMKRSKRR